jgi:hypothetical protein
MEAVYSGLVDQVKANLSSEKFALTVSQLKGLQRTVKVGFIPHFKTYNISEWNPILIAIAQQDLKMLTECFQP